MIGKCPNCGSAIKLDDERAIAFCPYCGTEIREELGRLDKILRHRETMKKLKNKHQLEMKNNDEISWWTPFIIFMLFIGILVLAYFLK